MRVNFFQIRCSEQSNKTYNFRKIIVVTSSLYDSIIVVVGGGGFISSSGGLFLSQHVFLSQSIEPGQGFTTEASLAEVNKQKNRYPNIVACKFLRKEEKISYDIGQHCEMPFHH